GDSELGTNEIARRTGINASTVSRLLATLVSSGLVEHVEDSGRYRLGVRLLQLGNIVLGRPDLREAARPPLQGPVDETGATAAPVLGPRGDLAAILGIQGPSTRFDRTKMRAAVEPLCTHARSVSLALGWEGNGR